MFAFVLAISLLVPQDGVVGGPLSDLVRKQIDAVSERLEKQHEERFGGVLSEIREARSEAKAAREESKALSGRLSDALDELQEARQERIQDRREREGLLSRLDEVVGKWTPVQNLVDRLTGLVWKLFWFVIAVCVVLGLIGALALAAYWKVNALIKKGVGL